MVNQLHGSEIFRFFSSLSFNTTSFNKILHTGMPKDIQFSKRESQTLNNLDTQMPQKLQEVSVDSQETVSDNTCAIASRNSHPIQAVNSPLS